MNMDSPEAFDGLRVVDLSGPSGFYCTKLLADMGADVVRVEPPDGETDHLLGPFFGDEADPNLSLYQWHFHTNKRSMLLDISSSSGRKVFDSLLSVADVLVDTYRPSNGTNANQRVLVSIRLQRLHGRAQAEIRRLLRLLLVWHGQMSTDATG